MQGFIPISHKCLVHIHLFPISPLIVSMSWLIRNLKWILVFVV